MKNAISILIILAIFISTKALAEPTHITVRVKTKDAKFLGTSMGGALITVKDFHTGELLDKGYTRGTTGDTQKMMKRPVKRGIPLSDENSAKFTATIDIDEPRLIEVTAYGPMAGLESANRVSMTQWVVPGKHITGGDGWLMELPGFLVDVLEPVPGTSLKGESQKVRIEANILML